MDDIRGAERGFTYRCDGPGSPYNRANGYGYDAEKIFCDKNGKVTRVPYREHVPPDVTACIFWLKNRKPPGGANRAQQGGDGLARDTLPGNCGRARRGLWRRIPDLPRRRHAFRRSRCATVGHGDQVGPGPRHGRRRADAQASARRRGARADLLRAHLQDRFRISEVKKVIETFELQTFDPSRD